jgi:hypothetical protein
VAGQVIDGNEQKMKVRGKTINLIFCVISMLIY